MKNSSKIDSRGFSLVELVFGVAILLIVAIGGLGSFINCMLLNRSNRDTGIAATDAQYVLEQIKAQGFSDISSYISGYPADQFTNLPGEVVSFPNPSYTSTLATITVQITWNERNAARNFSLTTRFAE